jgi:hypothetical protein
MCESITCNEKLVFKEKQYLILKNEKRNKKPNKNNKKKKLKKTSKIE